MKPVLHSMWCRSSSTVAALNSSTIALHSTQNWRYMCSYIITYFCCWFSKWHIECIAMYIILINHHSPTLYINIGLLIFPLLNSNSKNPIGTVCKTPYIHHCNIFSNMQNILYSWIRKQKCAKYKPSLLCQPAAQIKCTVKIKAFSGPDEWRLLVCGPFGWSNLK